jgi:hypothetical protein
MGVWSWLIDWLIAFELKIRVEHNRWWIQRHEKNKFWHPHYCWHPSTFWFDAQGLRVIIVSCANVGEIVKLLVCYVGLKWAWLTHPFSPFSLKSSTILFLSPKKNKILHTCNGVRNEQSFFLLKKKCVCSSGLWSIHHSHPIEQATNSIHAIPNS